MDIKNNILTNGFIVISNIFSLDEINIFKNEVNNYVKNNKTIRNASGITIPDFMGHTHLIMQRYGE